MLNASVAVLQDLGFTLEESETDLGVLLGTKDRDATEAAQVAGAIAMAILFGAYVPIDADQKIRGSVITRPLDDRRCGLFFSVLSEIQMAGSARSKA
ncbi:hypothetical protein [Nitratireductor sp. XY-223]|uniref:hypothetical protein n=1 Tax=Nitratireductor sp. XY-223 TaxID=2561926 RepID=UPI0010AA1CA3|nr:hypothetical protein [Nitratireductor sp. XY-223]